MLKFKEKSISLKNDNNKSLNNENVKKIVKKWEILETRQEKVNKEKEKGNKRNEIPKKLQTFDQYGTMLDKKFFKTRTEYFSTGLTV